MFGHLWTILPLLSDAVRPVAPPPSTPWQSTTSDGARVRGWLRQLPGSDTAVIIVHGMGGSPDSRYVRLAARAAEQAGMSVLRLGMRGSDRLGGDFYHAGLTLDLHAALGHPDLSAYKHLLLLGYSLGGHVALCAATEAHLDPRVRAVGAICAPVDLHAAQRAIDAPGRLVYRRYLLYKLQEMLDAMPDAPARAMVPARGFPSLRAWDSATVVPRFGFDGVDDYYTRAAFKTRRAGLGVAALLVSTSGDPMVPLHTVEPVGRSTPGLTFRVVRGGGHVAYPTGQDLALQQPVGSVESQVLGWLNSHK